MIPEEDILKIRELKNVEGLSQKKIAVLMGKSQQTISYVLTGKTRSEIKRKPVPDAVRVETVVLKDLPDNAFFKHINYAIP